MSQIDKVVYFPMLFWFVVFFSIFYLIVYSFIVPLVVSIITSREYEYFLMGYYGGAFTIVFIIMFVFLLDNSKLFRLYNFNKIRLTKLISYNYA